ncbi:phenylacetate--CoA ligase family protein [Pseudonocardia halophobica]|uniref:phenylacetate--CoA ligase family protein n=1 Tax=Pseudonocardia halophobica TaxID=29401 RepID=UPI003D8DC04C
MRATLARAERSTPGRIREVQERRLRLLVRLVAARSNFYRRWFHESGVDPSSIRTLDDLHRLPLIGREELMAAPEDFAVIPPGLMWPSMSSGTAGRPVKVYRTAGSSAYEQAALQRQWGWFGLRRGARRVVLRGTPFLEGNGPTLNVPGDRRLLVSSFHLTEATLPQILQQIRAFGAEAVEGWPSSLALLARLLDHAGERLPLTAVITSSEEMGRAQRQLLSTVYEAPIVDHYGQTERVTLAGGCEHSGYHLFTDYGITELLPLPGGEGRSEIVGTALHNFGFPLLRYRTGDEVGPAPAEPCPCGRPFPLMGALSGRVEESFTAADGRVIPLPSTVVDDLEGLAEVQIVQLGRGRFEIRAVPGPTFDGHTVRARALRNVEELMGPGQDVTFTVVSRIERSGSGKLRSVVVKVDESAVGDHVFAREGDPAR